MWTWLDSSFSARIRTYLDRALVRRTDTKFIRCPTFHWIGLTDYKLVRVSLQLVNWHSLISYWKFNISLLEIQDFQERLETLIQRVLVGAVTGNKCWGSLKYWISNFAIKYGKQLNLDRAKKAKSLDDRLSWAVEKGNSLAVDLARRDLDPSYRDKKRAVFLAILAVTRMVIWMTQKKGLYDGANFSHCDLIFFFRHRVKIKCDRKRLDRITFDKRWVYAASLVAWKGATLESSFSPIPAHDDDVPVPSGPHPQVSRFFCPPFLSPDLFHWPHHLVIIF